MLATLKQLPSDEAQHLLAGVTRNFLPDPGVGQVFLGEGADSSRQEQLLAEIRRHLHLDAHDDSPATKTKILEYLTREMSNLILAKADISSIKARLGQRGDLKPSLYRITFPDFFGDIEKRGIRRSHIEEALRQPNAVEHFLTEKRAGANFDAISLHLRHYVDKAEQRFTLLIQTIRKGDTLLVNAAWRIYHADVDLSQAYSPLAVLQAFVDVYGFECRVGDSHPAKFFLYEVVPLGTYSQTKFMRVEPKMPLSQSSGEAHWCARFNSSGMIEVALAV